MKLVLTAVACTVFASAALACGGPPICTVKDPTGSPLNLRQSAGGRIMSNLRNGQKLEVVDHVEIGGQRWARVAYNEPKAAEPGWVLKAYVRCGGVKSATGAGSTCVVRDPTGTPLNMRAQPNGEVVGSLRNGVRVRIDGEKVHNGKPWVLAERVAEDNAIGFVFDPYLKCEEDGQ